MTDADTTRSIDEEAPPGVEPLSVAEAATLCANVVENVGRVIVGHDDAVEHVVTAMFARGHVLLEDVPGVGKTMLARAIATSVECTFRRIQFTPDLLPADVTGTNVFDQRTREFEFQPGPVFGNVVLGDEINRAPAKTQAALLEAMAESQVTVDGETRALPDPFTVIATQNDVEPDRTYALPLAEVDRFAKKLTLGYPDVDEESELLARTVSHHPIESLEPVADLETLRRARETVARVTVSEPIRSYAARLAAYTREHARIGASPRGTIALVRAAQARAITDGRGYVVPDDVQHEAPVVLAHRIRSVGDGPASTETADRADRGREAGVRLVEDALAAVPVEGVSAGTEPDRPSSP